MNPVATLLIAAFFLNACGQGYHRQWQINCAGGMDWLSDIFEKTACLYTPGGHARLRLKYSSARAKQ